MLKKDAGSSDSAARKLEEIIDRLEADGELTLATDAAEAAARILSFIVLGCTPNGSEIGSCCGVAEVRFRRSASNQLGCLLIRCDLQVRVALADLEVEIYPTRKSTFFGRIKSARQNLRYAEHFLDKAMKLDLKRRTRAMLEGTCEARRKATQSHLDHLLEPETKKQLDKRGWYLVENVHIDGDDTKIGINVKGKDGELLADTFSFSVKGGFDYIAAVRGQASRGHTSNIDGFAHMVNHELQDLSK